MAGCFPDNCGSSHWIVGSDLLAYFHGVPLVLETLAYAFQDHGPYGCLHIAVSSF